MHEIKKKPIGMKGGKQNINWKAAETAKSPVVHIPEHDYGYMSGS